MKTEDIKNELNLNEEWKRGRKVKDDKGNVIREFKNEDEDYYLFVVTDPSDEKIIYYDYLDLCDGVTTEDLKDSSWPWAKYVFCYGISDYGDEPWLYITPYIYWRDEHCQYDQTIQSRFLTDEFSEAMECCYEFCGDSATEAINKLKATGLFIEDPEFAKFMGCMQESEGECDMQGRDFDFVCGCCHTNKCFLTLGDDQEQFYLTIKGSKFYIEEDSDGGAHEVTQKDVERVKNIFIRNPNMDFGFMGDVDPFCCDCEEDEVYATVYYKDGTIDDSEGNARTLAKKIYTGEVSLLNKEI